MRKLSKLESATAIILTNLMLASTAFNQSDTDYVSASIIDVSDASIDSVMSQYSALVLDRYKIECGPCEEMAAVLDKIAPDFRGKVTFGKIDMKDNLETKEKYKISSYPTLLLFDNGVLVDRIVGFKSKESIYISLLDAYT